MLCQNGLYDYAASLHVILTWAERHIARAHDYRRATHSYALPCPSHCRFACVRAQMSLLYASRRAHERA